AEDGGRDARSANGLTIGCTGPDVRKVEIFRETGGECVERGGSGAHHCRENTGNNEPAKYDWHVVDDVIAEDFVVGRRQRRAWNHRVVNRKKDADGEESARDW